MRKCVPSRQNFVKLDRMKDLVLVGTSPFVNFAHTIILKWFSSGLWFRTMPDSNGQSADQL